MKKIGFIIMACFVGLLMVSTATAVPTASSETVMSSVEKTVLLQEKVDSLGVTIKNLAGGALLNLLATILTILTSILTAINNILEAILGPLSTIVGFIDQILTVLEQLLDFIEGLIG